MQCTLAIARLHWSRGYAVQDYMTQCFNLFGLTRCDQPCNLTIVFLKQCWENSSGIVYAVDMYHARHLYFHVFGVVIKGEVIGNRKSKL